MRKIKLWTLLGLLVFLTACGTVMTPVPTATPEITPEATAEATLDPLKILTTDGNRIMTLAGKEKGYAQVLDGTYVMNSFLVFGASSEVLFRFSDAASNFPISGILGERGLNEHPIWLDPHPASTVFPVAIVFLLTAEESRSGDWPAWMAAELADAAINAIYKFGGEGTIEPCGQMMGIADDFAEKWGAKAGTEFAAEWVAKGECTTLPNILAEQEYPQMVVAGIAELGTPRGNSETSSVNFTGRPYSPYIAFAVGLGIPSKSAVLYLGSGEEFSVPAMSGVLNQGDFQAPGAEHNVQVYQAPGEAISIYLYFVGGKPESDPQILDVAAYLAQNTLVNWGNVCAALDNAVPQTMIATVQGPTTAGVYSLGPRWVAILNTLRHLECMVQ